VGRRIPGVAWPDFAKNEDRSAADMKNRLENGSFCRGASFKTCSVREPELGGDQQRRKPEVEWAVSRPSDQKSTGQGPAKPGKSWTKPELRKIELSDDEIAALRGAEDPMALLLKMKPELKRR
jgi:hypothetical protein